MVFLSYGRATRDLKYGDVTSTRTGRHFLRCFPFLYGLYQQWLQNMQHVTIPDGGNHVFCFTRTAPRVAG